MFSLARVAARARENMWSLKPGVKKDRNSKQRAIYLRNIMVSEGNLTGMVRQQKITSIDLGIDLASGQEGEYFKWFLACLLFGKPIQQEVAKRTYFEFVKEGLTTPDAILQAGWDTLVAVLDRGHYVRYDYSTATKLLDISKALKENYGTLTNLLRQAHSLEELSAQIEGFKGIGPKTREIFLRDIAPLVYSNHAK